MKKGLCALSFLFFASTVNAQVVVGPNTQYRFDFPTVDVVNFAITRFELKVDSGAYTTLGLPNPVTNDPNTPINSTTYGATLGTLTVGLHTAVVRACNAIGCGADSNSVSFRFLTVPSAPTLRLTQTIAVAGLINRAPYQLGNISVIDVLIPEYNVILNFGSPTWTIPGIYSAGLNDKVFLSLSK